MTDYQYGVEQASAIYKKVINEYVIETAQLQNLVLDMWNVMWTCAEKGCPHRHDDCYRVFGNGTSLPRGQGECWFEKRMAELGIMEGDSE